MTWLIALLKAIPALRRIGELLERTIKAATAATRRKRKDTLVDDAIADAITHPSKRVRNGKVRERKRPNKDAP
jgi:hypothetical protein